jgi:hypothetical protein
MWWGLVFALSILAAPLYASERIACVQSQLALLGYEVGVADGKIGSQTRAATRAALRDLGTDANLNLPFNNRRAGQWCRELGLYDPKLQAVWPSQNPLKIYTDRFENAIKRAVLENAETKARAFFADEFDVRLSGSFGLIGTDDPEQADTFLNEALSARGMRPRKTPLDIEKLCKGRAVGAAANRGFIVMCWRKPKAYSQAWSDEIMPRLGSILVHEYMHQVQYELAIDIPARRLPNKKDWLLGPSWMVEGSAEVIEELYENPVARSDDGTVLFNIQSSARRARVILSDLNQSGSVSDGAAYGTARFAAFILAKRHGVQSLFDYFQALGEVEDRDAAFRRVFGQSLVSFEAEFETLRRDFGAARDYIKKGT